jgi:Nuclease-related domain
MTELAIQLALVLGVLATFVVGPGLAIAFLLVRKKRRRTRRRSPIGIDLLRSPGHTVREQLDEASGDLIWDVLLVSMMPMAFLSILLAQGHVIGLDRMLALIPVYAIAGALFIAWMIRKMIRAGEHLDHLKAGFDAELAVGQELDQLMLGGARVFHDFPAEGFNIDHIVISPQGVFAIETKGYTKPGDMSGKEAAKVTFDGKALKFPNWTTKEPIEQAERQARWFSKWASSATGEQVLAWPVVALPGWFVERTGRSIVRVYSGRALGSLLNSGSAQSVSPQAVQRIAHQVEQRCRTVVPTYRREVDKK